MGSFPDRRITLEPREHFVSFVTGSSRFVRKCMKNGLTQGRSGRWVTLLPRKTFYGQDVQKYFPFFVSDINGQFIAILYFELSCNCSFFDLLRITNEKR